MEGVWQKLRIFSQNDLSTVIHDDSYTYQCVRSPCMVIENTGKELQNTKQQDATPAPSTFTESMLNMSPLGGKFKGSKQVKQVKINLAEGYIQKGHSAILEKLEKHPTLTVKYLENKS